MDDKIKLLPKDFKVKRNKITKRWAEYTRKRLADIEHKRELKRINDDYEPI